MPLFLAQHLSCKSPWAASRLLTRDIVGLTQQNMKPPTWKIYIQEMNVLNDLHRLGSPTNALHLFESRGSLPTFKAAIFEADHVIILGMQVKSRRLNRRGFSLGAKNDAFSPFACQPDSPIRKKKTSTKSPPNDIAGRSLPLKSELTPGAPRLHLHLLLQCIKGSSKHGRLRRLPKA
jgi:hypothetical protein